MKHSAITPHTLSLVVCLLFAVLASTARGDVQRAIADEDFSPLVHLAVTPPAATEAYAVEESISGTALPTAISHHGVYDAETASIKWGPFADGSPRNLNYRLSGPAGPVGLTAAASYGGVPENTPVAHLTLRDPKSNFYGVQYLTRSARDFTGFPFDPETVIDNDGMTELESYAFADDSSNLVIETTHQPPAAPTATVRARVNAAAADLAHSLDVSDNFIDWEPLETRIPGAGLTRREGTATPGIDELVFESIPLAPHPRLLFRLRSTLIATDAQ